MPGGGEREFHSESPKAGGCGEVWKNIRMSHGESRTVAGVEVIPICDAVGAMGESLRRPVEETFLGAAPHDWTGLTTDEWILHFHCHLLRADGRLALAD